MTIPLPTIAFSQVPRTAGPIQTAYGVNAAPASRIAAYVRSGGVQDGDDTFIMNNLVTTLGEGFKRCRPNMNDVVFVLPGHAESVDSATFGSDLVAGTNIIGLGNGADRPTLTWTLAAGKFLVSVPSVFIQNFRFLMAGDGSTITVAEGMRFDNTATDGAIVGCSFQTSIDGNQKASIGCVVQGDRMQVLGCDFFGQTSGEATTQLSIAGSDELKIVGCNFMGATVSTTVGLIRFTGESVTNMLIDHVNIQNRKALCVNAISSSGGISGVISNTNFGVLDAATLGGMSGKTDCQLFNCKTSNLATETGADTTAVST